MNSESRDEAAFEAALKLPPDERQGYLAKECADEPELRRRVEALIDAFERAGGFMKEPAVEMPAQTVRTPRLPTEKPGDRIGRYKLLQQIGEGGCGVVYMAEQEEPVRRRVALKVIKLGMDTKQVIARFEAERQALALMSHPNIARVLDAGATDSGRPFFVMELVRGLKITDFCDQKKLSFRERLELFIPVCQAIQHAHQKGIVHRDLKPSNVLVTTIDGVAVPKVIDFGIAKATNNQPLTDQTLFTAFDQFIGTPAYMSPEQAELSGVDVDTRTDIYSLGVVLYELLTGKTPFDAQELLQGGLDEIRRTIRETEPLKPSTRLHTLAEAELTTVAQARQADAPRLVHQVRGDLDWVVMKCLEKDRNRRYETANGLATDLQRHLQNEPVAARPPSTVYRFQKFVRRNKLAFTAAAAVIAALLVGFGTSTWMFLREREAKYEQERLRRRAETESTKSREVAQFLKDMLERVGPSVALGRDQTMLREILDETAERIDKELENQPEIQVELLNTIGFVYWELGRLEAAVKMYRARLDIMRKLWGNEHPQVAATLHNIAEVLRRNGRTREATVTEREALAISENIFGEEHPAVAASLNNLAFLLGEGKKLDEAETLFRRALSMNRKLLGAEHPQVGICLSRFGTVLEAQGKLPEAEAMYREAVAIQTKLLGNKMSDLAVKRAEQAPNMELAWTLNYLSRVLDKQSRISEAEGAIDEAMAVISKVVAANHPDRGLLFEGYIRFKVRHGRLAEAVADLSRVRDTNPDNHLVWSQLAAILVQKGDIALYRENCRRSIERFGDSKIPVVAHRIVKACLILPDSGVDLRIVDRMADVSLGGERKLGPLGAAKALAEYRLGRFASAADWAEKALTNEAKPGWVTVHASAALAMARHQLKQNELAQSAWARAQDDGNKHLPELDSLSWVDVIIAHALLREAKALVEGTAETEAETK